MWLLRLLMRILRGEAIAFVRCRVLDSGPLRTPTWKRKKKRLNLAQVLGKKNGEIWKILQFQDRHRYDINMGIRDRSISLGNYVSMARCQEYCVNGMQGRVLTQPPPLSYASLSAVDRKYAPGAGPESPRSRSLAILIREVRRSPRNAGCLTLVQSLSLAILHRCSEELKKSNACMRWCLEMINSNFRSHACVYQNDQWRSGFLRVIPGAE